MAVGGKATAGAGWGGDSSGSGEATTVRWSLEGHREGGPPDHRCRPLVTLVPSPPPLPSLSPLPPSFLSLYPLPQLLVPTFLLFLQVAQEPTPGPLQAA